MPARMPPLMHVEHAALAVGQGGGHVHAVEALLAPVRPVEAEVVGPAQGLESDFVKSVEK